ncbi:hypothetical protein XH86_19520 [Bradyrhizobium guangdongense]|uniref:Uncharacterized protein n=1 Tax=Bradyrhizobium guangdongense TaxID=1325090 RepID=A0A7S7ZS76_9BRAD|nr:hypothetical protein XH86_19520 [Bradyrhizobium guangdongense]
MERRVFFGWKDATLGGRTSVEVPGNVDSEFGRRVQPAAALAIQPYQVVSTTTIVAPMTI